MKRSKFLVIALVTVALALAFFAVTFLLDSPENVVGESAPIPFSKLEIELLENGNLSFLASIRKEQLANLAEEGATFGTVLDTAIKFLPEMIDISGEIVCHKTDDEERFFKFVRLAVNEYEIPGRLLSGIGEFRLDFERSLVYNRQVK